MTMTKSEKLSTILSVVAISISILTPIFSYYWLDPSLQAFKLRARLQVSGHPSKALSEYLKKQNPSPVAIKETDPDRSNIVNKAFQEALEMSALDTSYEVEIVNVGKLPAKDIQIVAEYIEHSENGIQFDPPVQSDLVSRDNKTFITLKRPLAPQDKIKIVFKVPPVSLWVSNEFGETDTIKTDIVIPSSGWIYMDKSGRVYKVIGNFHIHPQQ
jgi:hypothetical protein